MHFKELEMRKQSLRAESYFQNDSPPQSKAMRIMNPILWYLEFIRSCQSCEVATFMLIFCKTLTVFVG